MFPALGTAQRSEGSKALPLGCQHYSGHLTAKLPEEAGSLSLLEKLVLTESSCTDARAWGGILGSVNMLFQEQVMPIRCRVWEWLMMSINLALLCPFSGLTLHLFPFPALSCKGQAFHIGGVRGREITIWKISPLSSAVFLQLQRFLLCKNKKKKSFICKIFTYHIWKGIFFHTFWNALKMGIKESKAY